MTLLGLMLQTDPGKRKDFPVLLERWKELMYGKGEKEKTKEQKGQKAEFQVRRMKGPSNREGEMKLEKSFLTEREQSGRKRSLSKRQLKPISSRSHLKKLPVLQLQPSTVTAKTKQFPFFDYFDELQIQRQWKKGANKLRPLGHYCYN